MNPIISIAKIGIPDFVKSRILKSIFEITGKSFSCDVPDIHGLTYEQLLELYSGFSREVSEDAIKAGKDLIEVTPTVSWLQWL